ncbi:MAG TPA: methyltransferase domain-containing protein [Acidobacteriaceae bacterium]|nr:methyltransferase domain-containing protein [Acidobacteriaceae bacterium]
MVRLKAQDGLRVLDVGPTSPSNINYLTSLGHSVFMADLIEESTKPEWIKKSTEEDSPDTYDAAAFIEKHMNFGHRMFDVVLLWDALNYVPEPLVSTVVRRLHEATVDEGEILCLFHTRANEKGSAFCRYHLTDTENIEMQEYTPHPPMHIYQNRAIEKLFAEYHFCRLFLAKDNLCEVLVTR